MKGLCKFNKMINCMEHTKCDKCTWNPEYFDELKKKRRAEAKEKLKAEQSIDEKEM